MALEHISVDGRSTVVQHTGRTKKIRTKSSTNIRQALKVRIPATTFHF